MNSDTFMSFFASFAVLCVFALNVFSQTHFPKHFAKRIFSNSFPKVFPQTYFALLYSQSTIAFATAEPAEDCIAPRPSLRIECPTR